METYRIILRQDSYRGKTNEKEVKGTLEELIAYFEYSLIIGSSYDKKVRRNPKTIERLVDSVNRSYQAVNKYGASVRLA